MSKFRDWLTGRREGQGARDAPEQPRIELCEARVPDLDRHRGVLLGRVGIVIAATIVTAAVIAAGVAAIIGRRDRYGDAKRPVMDGQRQGGRDQASCQGS